MSFAFQSLMEDFRRRDQVLIFFNLSTEVAEILLGPDFDSAVVASSQEELESKLLGIS